MNLLTNFTESSKELDNYLTNLLTDSKNNQHYEKTIEHTDYSKCTISQLRMQEIKPFTYIAFDPLSKRLSF